MLTPATAAAVASAFAACSLLPLNARGQANPPRAVAPVLVIEHATVLPMDRDTVLRDHAVLLRDGRIAWLGPTARAVVPAGARRIDAAGAFLMPGLADMHVHARRADLPRYAASGITTIRNMRGGPEHLAWRAEVADGRLLGPRIYTAGPGVGRRLFGDRSFLRIRTHEQAAAVVRDHAAAGYDVLKVFNRIEPDVYAHLLRTARNAGIPVVGHVVAEVGLSRSLAAGQVSLEHATDVLSGDAGTMARSARRVAAAGAWIGTIVSDRDGGCAPPSPEVRRVIAAARTAGVRLLVGSDAGIGPVAAGQGLHCELQTLIAAGLPPFDALAAATRDAGTFARLHLGEREPFGTVTVGARADLLLLDGDPRADLSALTRVRDVILRGISLRGGSRSAAPSP